MWRICWITVPEIRGWRACYLEIMIASLCDNDAHLTWTVVRFLFPGSARSHCSCFNLNGMGAGGIDADGG